jgi:hypothetical protein
MSAPIDPANTSTSADGQTKHRALGATIDGEPRIATGADLDNVDADNGSSSVGSGGKRKRVPGAAGMIFDACFWL